MKTHLFSLALVLLTCIQVDCGYAQASLPMSRDWHPVWISSEQKNTDNFITPKERWRISPTYPDIAQRFSYDQSSYIIPAYLLAAQVAGISSQDKTRYHTMAGAYLGYMFNPALYYVDVPANIASDPNGLQDGYRGWANRTSPGTSFTSNRVIGESIDQNVWYDIRIQVTDSTDENNPPIRVGTRVEVWVSRTGAQPPTEPVYSEMYNPRASPRELINNVDATNERFPFGTIALLSGWSDTRFKDIVVTDIRVRNQPVTVYRSSDRLLTFLSDWAPVVDTMVAAADNITADYLHSNWTVDTQSGEIRCNAASTAPLGVPVTSRFFGKYAAVLLDTTNSAISQLQMQEVNITFKMLIERRNIATAESGMAVRWVHPTGGSVTGGAGRMSITPTELASLTGNVPDDLPSFTGGTPSTPYDVPYNYFQPFTAHIAIKLRPADCLQVVQYRRFRYEDDYGIYWLWPYWYAPWDEEGKSTLNESGYAADGFSYDGQIIGAAGLFEHFYPGSGLPYIAQAENTDGVVPKWRSVIDRGSATWNYGGGHVGNSHNLGDWDKALLWTGTLGRFGQMCARLSRDPASIHHGFYEDMYQKISRKLLTKLFWTDATTDSYQWANLTDYIGEMYNARNNPDRSSDIQHEATTVTFLREAHTDSTVTGVTHDDMRKLTRAFTTKIWNQDAFAGSDLAYNMNGTKLDAKPGLFDWPLLSKYDFMVWEITDGYCNRSGSHWNRYKESSYGRLAAEMLYTVRHGIPRDLGVDTIRACSGGDEQDYILRWRPPSDYPIGFQASPAAPRKPGTRLQSYNIYKKLPSETAWRQTPIQVFPRNVVSATGLSWQESYPYPWWRDNAAQPGSTWQYMIRTQDWSTGIVNESDPSDVITITYPTNRINTQIPSTATVTAGQVLDLQPGVYYIPFVLRVEQGGTLTIPEGTVLNFADSMWLSNSGTMTAIGASGCPGRIVFQGTHELPGSWWGIYHEASSVHTMRECIVRHGIENIVLHNPAGEIAFSEIYGASRVGIIILNGQDGTATQRIDDCSIHHNDWRNVLVWSQGPGTIVPLLRRNTISASKQGDGVTIIGPAAPTIQDCAIHDNAGHGVRIEMSPATTILRTSTIENHTSHHGVSLLQGGALLQQNTINDNQVGVSVEDASMMEGGTSYGDNGYNDLDNNDVHLHVQSSSVLFGLWVTPTNIEGAYNCFTDPLQAHVIADQTSTGSIDADGFSPDNPMLFQIATNPDPVLSRTHDISCANLRVDSSIALSRTGVLSTTTLAELHAALTSGDHARVLATMRVECARAGMRARFLPVLSRFAAKPNGHAYRVFIDSLASTWSGQDRLVAVKARLSYLLAGNHWGEARRTIQEYVGNTAAVSQTAHLYSLFIDACDAATRPDFLSTWFPDGRVAYGDSSLAAAATAFYYAPPTRDVPYPMPKNMEADGRASFSVSPIIVYPNPSRAGALTLTLSFDGGEVGTLRITTVLGEEVKTMIIHNADVLESSTINIRDLPTGTFILHWQNGTTRASQLVHILK